MSTYEFDLAYRKIMLRTAETHLRPFREGMKTSAEELIAELRTAFEGSGFYEAVSHDEGTRVWFSCTYADKGVGVLFNSTDWHLVHDHRFKGGSPLPDLRFDPQEKKWFVYTEDPVTKVTTMKCALVHITEKMLEHVG